jgi:hypothetical protein
MITTPLPIVFLFNPVAFTSQKNVYIYMYNFMLFVLYFLSFLFSLFHKNLFIMLYNVFYYCWRMCYCNYLLCGEDPCKLLKFVSNPIVIIFSNKLCFILIFKWTAVYHGFMTRCRAIYSNPTHYFLFFPATYRDITVTRYTYMMYVSLF